MKIKTKILITLAIFLFCVAFCMVIVQNSMTNRENDQVDVIIHADITKDIEKSIFQETPHTHNYINCFCSCGKFIEIDEDDKTVILNSSRLSGLELDSFPTTIIIPETIDISGEEYTIVGINNNSLIGKGVFEGNKEIEQIILPETITYIGDYSFNGCENLKTVNLPDGLQYIGKAAFQCCYSLEYIEIPDSVEYIGDFAYNHCTGAQNTIISLPSNLKRIGEYYHYPTHAFYDCGTDDTFTSFIISEDNDYYETIDGILYTKGGATLVSIPRGKIFENNTYIMPDTVENLGELSFSRNKNIETVIISDNLIIDGEMDSYEEKSYLCEGNDLSIACYIYTEINAYEVKQTNENYRSQDGILYSYNGKQIIAIPNDYTGAIDIPEGTEEWAHEALWVSVIEYFKDISLNKITEINIPFTMETIDEEQMEGINLLVDLYDVKVNVSENNEWFYVDDDGHIQNI